MGKGDGKNDMTAINEEYREKCNTPSDINKLLPIMKKFADGCNHITELGTGKVVSTWALLAAKPKRFVTYDIIRPPDIERAEIASERAGIDFEFRKTDVSDIEIEETDVLFIDTYHHYNQLIHELRSHGSKVNKYIIMHDTTTYGKKNETMAEDCKEGLKEMGTDLNKYGTSSKKGLMRAIRDFLKENKQWKLEKRILKNNGLTILSRI
ncbi:MAG: hypothetical protein JXQ30_06690 [Spirochaetes bacterium]|nr:hypothetical protein [Spirochaetota bacterium]